jgi:hypothetical protein
MPEHSVPKRYNLIPNIQHALEHAAGLCNTYEVANTSLCTEQTHALGPFGMPKASRRTQQRVLEQGVLVEGAGNELGVLAPVMQAVALLSRPLCRHMWQSDHYGLSDVAEMLEVR